MGYHENIGINIFPAQGKWAGKRVSVCFNYDTSFQLKGRIVRDDAESPFRTIIQLDNGRVILGTECQFNIEDK